MYTNLLNKAIEIEGLIRILRDGDAAPEVISLLKEKTASLSAEVVSIEVPVPAESFERQIPEAPVSEDSGRSVPRPGGAEEAAPAAIATSTSADDDIILSLDDDVPLQQPAPRMPSSAAVFAAAKDIPSLKSLFSLNDRFLFSRELFGGDMKMFDSTLKFLEGIKDFSDIEDYFYSELEWNPEDANVASFLEILRPHFND